jgi:hypothetical protein
MTVVMDKSLREKLDRVKAREWWPVASLAEVLGKPKMYIYRKVEDGKFHVLNDGGFVKVISESVVRYFFEDHHQIV